MSRDVLWWSSPPRPVMILPCRGPVLPRVRIDAVLALSAQLVRGLAHRPTNATTRQAELDQGLSRVLVIGLETISDSGHNADARNKFGVSLLLATLGWLRVVLGVLNLQMRQNHLEIRTAPQIQARLYYKLQCQTHGTMPRSPVTDPGSFP